MSDKILTIDIGTKIKYIVDGFKIYYGGDLYDHLTDAYSRPLGDGDRESLEGEREEILYVGCLLHDQPEQNWDIEYLHYAILLLTGRFEFITNDSPQLDRYTGKLKILTEALDALNSLYEAVKCDKIIVHEDEDRQIIVWRG